MFWNEFFSSWAFFVAIFSFWDMVDFVLNIRSELVWDLTNSEFIFMLGGLHPQVPDSFELNPPSQLVGEINPFTSILSLDSVSE